MDEQTFEAVFLTFTHKINREKPVQHLFRIDGLGANKINMIQILILLSVHQKKIGAVLVTFNTVTKNETGFSIRFSSDRIISIQLPDITIAVFNSIPIFHIKRTVRVF